MIGFVKLSRDILQWEWYTQPTVSRVYFHLLLKANYEPKRWRGILVNRGQLITSLAHLSTDLDLSIQQIRTALDKLEKTNYITRKSHIRFTLLTLVAYEESQGMQGEIVSSVTSKQQANNNLATTTKESKEVNKKKNIELRKKEFRVLVFKHTTFSEKNLTEFYDYWSEMDENKTKMKFESLTFFEVSKRIQSWVKKQENWQKKQALSAKSITINR
tara:strand:- start:435 stop:1082 length:648 start_codon:yes stop_codon:yes gene_type:complete